MATTPHSTTLPLPPIDVLAMAAAELAQAAREVGDTANMHALDKATLHLHHDVRITPTADGFLIPSGTRGGIVHRVSHVYGCSCEAGSRQHPCWHAAVLEIVERAQTRVVELPPRTAHDAYALALAELNELFV